MKIDYKLAKELKDAGFPQEMEEDSFFYSQQEDWDNDGADKKVRKLMYDGRGLWPSNKLNKDRPDLAVKAPTLSELIEECGIDDMFQLHCVAGKWHTTTWKDSHTSTEKMYVGSGKTPIEAVSKLYIALNKKHD